MIAKDELQRKVQVYESSMGSLALERLEHTRRIEEIDTDIGMYKAAVSACRQAIEDIAIEEKERAKAQNKEEIKNV